MFTKNSMQLDAIAEAVKKVMAKTVKKPITAKKTIKKPILKKK